VASAIVGGPAAQRRGVSGQSQGTSDHASYRFVRFLIERAGMATFLTLYEARDPEGEYLRLYGASRQELALAAAK